MKIARFLRELFVVLGFDMAMALVSTHAVGHVYFVLGMAMAKAPVNIVPHVQNACVIMFCGLCVLVHFNLNMHIAPRTHHIENIFLL